MDESLRILNEIRVGMDVAGKYRVESLLGHGGMGAVFSARHLGTGRRVALKFLLADQKDLRLRMQREALAMGALAHPNVVSVLDVGDHGGTVFLVMELLVGKSLHDYVDGRILPPHEAIALVVPAMQGVEAAHRAGFVHRDLKPENLFVMLDEHGVAYDTKVLDFGIARPLGARGELQITRSGAIVGTPRYMAPEQIRGGQDLGPQTDVWALGLILYELLVGRTPYEAQSYESLILEIATQRPPSPQLFSPDVDANLAAVILRALEKRPSERFASVMEFAKALEPFADGVRFVAPRGVHVANADAVELLRPPAGDEPTQIARPSTPANTTRPLGARGGETSSPVDSAPGAVAWHEESSPRIPTLPPRRSSIARVAGAALLVATIVAIGWALLGPGRATPTSTEAAPTTTASAAPPVAAPAPELPHAVVASSPPPVVPTTTTQPAEAAPPPTETHHHASSRAAAATPTVDTAMTVTTETSARSSHEARGRAGTIRSDDF